MKVTHISFLLLHCLATVGLAQVVINEVDVDQSGADAAEFVELYDGGIGNTSLDGLVLVLMNGRNDSSYRAIDLNGQVTGPAGFLVIGNPGVPNVSLEVASGAIQNGPDAIALYIGSVDEFSSGAAVTDENLVDALVYGTNDSDDFELLDILTPGEFQVNDTDAESMSRIPDGGDPRVTSSYEAKTPTPGFANVVLDALKLKLSADTVREDAGAEAVMATLTRTGSTEAALAVSIGIDDFTEIGAPETVEIPAGETQINFMLDVVDDLWPDAIQLVAITATGQGVSEGFALIEVTDDGDVATLVVNEVYPDDRDDANLDNEGELDGAGKDEFVELVNTTTEPLNLSNHTLRDAVALRHQFPEGTTLDPGCALVIFGGGAVIEGNNALFGGALVQLANGSNGFGLGLNNSGDFVRILNEDDVEVAGLRYDAVFGGNGSIARDPDLEGGFVPHFDILDGDGPFGFTPGLRADSSPFCTLTDRLTLSLDVATIAENAGEAAATLTIERSGSTTGTLLVTLSNADPSEMVLSEMVEISEGATSVTVPINAVDDVIQDGTIEVQIVATAPDFINAEIVIDVLDDGDEPVVVVINEVDSDQPGNDDSEFVELYDGGIGNVPLDGLIVVLFNGADGESYRTMDLSNQSTDAEGFFVIGDPAVLNVDLAISSFILQNGLDAVAVYRTPADVFPNGSFASESDLVDAVIYGTSVGDAMDLLLVLTPGQPQAHERESNNETSVSRQPDGGDPLVTGSFVALPPSPGGPNGQDGGTTGYLQWASEYADLGDPSDDPDQDALVNVLEYALGLDPLTNNTGHAPSVERTANGSLILSLRMTQGLPADVTLNFESSATLNGVWQPIEDADVTSRASQNGGDMILAFDLGGFVDAANQFVRIRVQVQ